MNAVVCSLLQEYAVAAGLSFSGGETILGGDAISEAGAAGQATSEADVRCASRSELPMAARPGKRTLQIVMLRTPLEQAVSEFYWTSALEQPDLGCQDFAQSLRNGSSRPGGAPCSLSLVPSEGEVAKWAKRFTKQALPMAPRQVRAALESHDPPFVLLHKQLADSVRKLGARLGYRFSAPPAASSVGHPSASSWPKAGISLLSAALDRNGLYGVHAKGVKVFADQPDELLLPDFPAPPAAPPAAATVDQPVQPGQRNQEGVVTTYPSESGPSGQSPSATPQPQQASQASSQASSQATSPSPSSPSSPSPAKLPPVDTNQQKAYREAAEGLVNLLRGSGHAKDVAIYTQGDSTMWRQTRWLTGMLRQEAEAGRGGDSHVPRPPYCT
jgi:hypothetical protein